MLNRASKMFETGLKSDQTRKNYHYSLNEFMRFTKTKNYEDILKIHPDKIQEILENWTLHLIDRKLKPITIRNKLSAVQLFLEMNRITVHKRILNKMIPSDDYIFGGEIPFTSSEIQRMLNSTTKLRTKAIILFLASTGARPAVFDDPPLRLKHMEKMSTDCKAVKLYDGSKHGYWAFLTPEATKALNCYLQSRKRNDEILTEESPIFANHNYKVWSTKNDYISSKAVRGILYNVLKSAGIERKKEGNRFDKAVSYGFRKRFNTTLKLNNNVNSNIAEKLMAHKRGLDGAYLKPTKEQCFVEFVKAIPELTIDPTERQSAIIDKKNEEISELQRSKERIEKLENGQQELCDLIYLKEAVKFVEDPNFLKKLKWRGLDGKEITDEKEIKVICQDWVGHADHMRKEINQLSEKYMDKICR